MTFCDRRIGDTKASENGIGFCAKGNLTLMLLHFILLMLLDAPTFADATFGDISYFICVMSLFC